MEKADGQMLWQRFTQRYFPSRLSFRIWYRHSGEEEIQDIPYQPTCRTFQDEREITAEIGDHHITHMVIGNGRFPQLDVIAPNLTHLKIERVNKYSQLQCLSKLSQLRDLFLSGIKFSPRLPAVIGEINSLNKLFLENCNLTTLPESLSKLSQLRDLCLSSNNFSAGLPAVIGEINSLNKLFLENCHLTTLPERLCHLKQLKDLYLGGNKFEQLPSVIHSFSELERLNLSHSDKLRRIDDDFLRLTKLTELDCSNCKSLVYPPHALCQQGLSAVRRFFNDIKLAKGIEKTIASVAIIGLSMSGKSSLVKSLKAGKRTLTYRETNFPLDETTKAFQVEDLQLPSSQLKLIYFGGNDVHRITYKMMIKEQYLPLVVVNLEQFSTLSSSIGSNEATRQVCMDRLVPLYLACPRLGRPILVITHVDKLSSENAKSCIKDFLAHAEVIRKVVLDEKRVHPGSFQDIIHLSNTQALLFASEDIFEFGNDTTTTSNIQRLKDNLEGRSKEFNVVIPWLWEELASYVHGHTDSPYMSISDITARFSGEDCLVILRYMHDIGDILWFEKINGLRGYLFHQLPAITEMVTVLFDHCSEHQWKRRLEKFIPFYCGNQLISKEKYDKLIEEFIHSGVIDKALLIRLLETESKFPPEVALKLLKCFCIVHGPIKKESADAYVIPFFAPAPKDASWKSDGPLQLRLDITLEGMTLPNYFHHLITVTLLNGNLGSTDTIEVANNGATVYHGCNTTHLVHDFVGGKVTLQISTPVELLGDSWKCLIDAAALIFSLLAQEWKACHVSFKFFCSHCLFLNDPNPDFDVNPSWFSPIYNHNKFERTSTALRIESFQGILPVTCSRDATRKKSKKPTVPKPLKFPFFHLTTEETQLLKNYLLQESTRYHSAIDVDIAVGGTSVQQVSRRRQKRDQQFIYVDGPGYSHLSAISTEHGPLTENGASSFASTVNIQSTSTADGNIQSTSTAAGNIQSTSTAAGNIQSTSTVAGNIQSTSTVAGNNQSTSTVADVDGETSYGLNFDLEPRRARDSGSQLPDVDEQGYGDPSSTSVGDMKVESQTGNTTSSFTTTDTIHSTSTAVGASGLGTTSTETTTSGDSLEFTDHLCDNDNTYQP